MIWNHNRKPAESRRALRRLFDDRRGVVAIVVAVALPAMIGAGALAVDVAMLRYVQNRLQSVADAAALASVGEISNVATAKARATDYAARNVPDSYGTVVGSSDVEIGIFDAQTGVFTPGGNVADQNAVRVTAARAPERGNGVSRILSFLWGDSAFAVTAQATAARHLVVQYEPPARWNMDNEAGDYNELYVYCYRYTGTGTAASRRSQMTLISNNMGNQNIVAISGGVISVNPPTDPDWPQCGLGESLSFRLRNIRHAKSMPTLWANPNTSPRRPEFNYFSDTVIADGRETFSGTANSIIETVRCDELDKCDPSKPGNIIPKGKNRTPVKSDLPCMPGKFMYFGWEDRPPGQTGANRTWTDPAWTDRDFDDIRIVMRCPRVGRLGDGMARLVG